MFSAFVAACATLAFPVVAEATLSWSAPIAIDSGTALTGVDCPSPSQCTAVDARGRAITFDPASQGPFAPPTVIDQGTIASPHLAGLGCTLKPASQCTTVDNIGQEVTFNPSTFSILSFGTIDLGNSLVHFICPSTLQCTAIDSAGQQVTFNPGPPLTVLTTTPIDTGANLGAVACPLVTQCVAVDGGGQVMMFSPNPYALKTPLTVIDSGAALTAVACPQTNQCDAVDNNGQELRFDPAFPLPATRVTIDSGAQLNALACGTALDCVAVGSNPVALEGNPQQPSVAWTVEPIPGAAPLAALSCVHANGVVTQCVAVDSSGNAFLGTPTLPPVNTALPTIAGNASQGQTLMASNGSWTNNPTGYGYQWDDCNVLGCSPIGGATGQTYTLGAADVGDKVEVIVTASNAGGSGTATSVATTVVTAPPGQPPPNVVPALKLAGVSHAGSSALVSLTCYPLAPGKSCSGNLVMTVKERKRGATMADVSANSVSSGSLRRAGTTTAVVTIGGGTYSVPSGQRVTVTLGLNSIGHTLLNQFYRLHATVTLAGAVPQMLGVTIAYPPLPVLEPGWNVYQSYTTLQLSVTGLAARAKVAVTCRGGGCPFRRRVKHTGGGQISLTGWFARSRLKPGAVVQITVAAPGSVEKIWTIRIRNGLSPSQTKSCVPPGDRHPRACVTLTS